MAAEGYVSGAASQAYVDAAVEDAGDGARRPEDSGYLAWSGPLFLHNSSIVMASHTYYLGSLRSREGGGVGRGCIQVQNVGSGLTDFRVSVYDAVTGPRLGTTGNVAAAINGTGGRALTLAFTLPEAGKWFYIVWCIAGTGPTLTATTNSNGSVVQNDPAMGSAVRVTGTVSDGGSGTDTPASLTINDGVVSGFSQSGQQIWLGLAA